MAEKLGICVATQNCFHHALGLARAARGAGKQVEIFLTGEGIELTQNSQFSELLETADLAVCEVSYIARGYKGQAVPGLVDKDFVTQARNAEMVEECDRYLIL
jgi:predicted peroxiredoxin